MSLDVDDHKVSGIAADLVGRACLREQISKARKLWLILHAHNTSDHAAEPAGGTERTNVVLARTYLHRQPVFGIPVQDDEIQV